MIVFRRFSVFFTPLILFVLVGLGLYFPGFFYYAIPSAAVVLIFTLKSLIKHSWQSKEFLFYSVPPVVLFLSTIGFVILQEQAILRNTVLVVLTLALILYLENVFTYFFNRRAYQLHALDNISSYFNIVSVFFFAITAYGFVVLLNIPLWVTTLILAGMIALLTAQSFWAHNISVRGRVYVAVLTLLMVELFWAISYLPNNFYVTAVLLSICYYVLWGLFRAQLLSLLSKRLFLRYIVIAGGLAVLIITTSRWI